jgi:hypothetical protein
VEQLFQFVVGFTEQFTHIRLHLWLSRINEAIKEGRQENDLPELREEIAGAIVQPGALGSEDQSQSSAV